MNLSSEFVQLLTFLELQLKLQLFYFEINL